MSEEVKQDGKGKKKKITKMSVSEVEAAIKEVESKMGGLGSKYAKHLLNRKAVLTT